MSDLMRAAIDAALPNGSIWNPEPDGDLDKLLDGSAENLETLRLFLSGIKDVRNPTLTDYLDELEREFGTLTNMSLTDAQRRAQLHPLVYGRGGGGTIDDMQTALDNAGFNVTVYANDPAVDPSPFLTEMFQMVAGGGNAFAGNAGAFARRIGGELLVNGDIFKMSRIFTSVAGNLYAGAGHGAGEYVDLLRSKVEYPIPTDPGDWPLVFFVGGAATFTPGFDYDADRDLFLGTLELKIDFSSDGRWLFTQDGTGFVSAWMLLQPFDTRTAQKQAFKLDISAVVTLARGIAISDDGRHLFLSDETQKRVHSWTLVTPFLLETASYDVGDSKDVSADVTQLQGIEISPDGLTFYVSDINASMLLSYTMSTAFQPSSGVLSTTKSTLAGGFGPSTLRVTDDGKRVRVNLSVTKKIATFDMTVARDLTTAVYDSASDFGTLAQDNQPSGFAVSPDESRLFLHGRQFRKVYSYSSGLKITDIAKAQVPAAQEQAFKRIILGIKPAHSWGALIVEYT